MKMTRKELIKKMEGRIIRIDGKWLSKNDEEMLDWLTDYWGGCEDVEDVVLELHFEAGGVAYKATLKGHPEGVTQSLVNQPMWDSDPWADWPNELIEKYYLLLK
jgi:hypothetical protein